MKPAGYLVCGGRLYTDKCLTTQAEAQASVSARNDGARIEPLFTREQMVAAMEAMRAECKLFADESACYRINEIGADTLLDRLTAQTGAG